MTQIEAQDLFVFLVQKHQKGLVILVNKWDAIQKKTNTAPILRMLSESASPPSPTCPSSSSPPPGNTPPQGARGGNGCVPNKQLKISTSELNEVMLAAAERYQPPTHRGKLVRIGYVVQVNASIPTFLFFCNYPDHVKENYALSGNQLRKRFKLTECLSMFLEEVVRGS